MLWCDVFGLLRSGRRDDADLNIPDFWGRDSVEVALTFVRLRPDALPQMTKALSLRNLVQRGPHRVRYICRKAAVMSLFVQPAEDT
jgi:hypothetical protein